MTAHIAEISYCKASHCYYYISRPTHASSIYLRRPLMMIFLDSFYLPHGHGKSRAVAECAGHIIDVRRAASSSEMPRQITMMHFHVYRGA